MRIQIGARQTMERLEEMLDGAMDGTFEEDHYDETELSRLESGILEIQPVKQSLKPLLEGVAETFGPGAGEKDMTLECVLPPEEVLCRYDRKWTGEALGNVVDNAIKYAPAGFRVRIRVREFEFYVCIQVEDQGPGIPEEEGSCFGLYLPQSKEA